MGANTPAYYFQTPANKQATIDLAHKWAVKRGEAGVLVIRYSDGSCYAEEHTSVSVGQIKELAYGEHYDALHEGDWLSPST